MIDWVKEGRRTPEQARRVSDAILFLWRFQSGAGGAGAGAGGAGRRRVRTVWSWIVRIAMIAVCVFLTFRSAHIALADLRAQRNGLDGLDSAIRMEPGDSVLLARDALFRNNNDDLSPAEDQRLEHAADLDPLNADLPMALGLRAEFRGHPAEAERYLVHAAEIDHTFRPAWTLANFYFRSDQPDKSWPMIQRALNLNPLAFDPTAVFDLCWNLTNDSKRILDMIPSRGGVPLQYLYYLMNHKRTDAAIESWPRVLNSTDVPATPSINAMTAFVDSVLRADRVPDAVRLWNQMVDRKLIESGRLDPAAGVSITDPDFSFPLIERGFGWRVTHDARVSVVKSFSSLRFEFDGNEPESLVLLTTVAPLVSDKAYKLAWKTDTSSLSSRRDAGFVLQVIQEPGHVATECQPMLQSGEAGACQFTSHPNAGWARINVMYKRALGTTLVQGTLEIDTLKLGFGS